MMSFKIAPFETTLNILFQMAGLAIAPISVLVTAYFIDTALSLYNEGFINTYKIITPIMALAIFQMYEYLIEPINSLLNKKRDIKVQLSLRVPLIESRARLEYKHLENNATVDLLNRVWQNPDGRLAGTGSILSSLLDFIVLTGKTLSFAIILLTNAFLSGVILLVLSIPMIYIAIKGGKATYQAQRETTQRERLSSNINYILTARDTAAERNLFGYSKYLINQYKEHYESARKYRFNVFKKNHSRSIGVTVIMALLSIIAMFLLVPDVANGNLSVGLYVALLGALLSIINSLGWGLPIIFREFATQKEYINDFNQFLSLTKTFEAETRPSLLSLDFKSLEFRNVSFSYPGTEKTILDDISFEIECGKHYAIVGLNGAGKTTIIKLITRLYEEYKGEILLNKKPLQQWSMSELKTVVCALFQDYARYDISVSDNVAIGKINNSSDDDIDRAINLSGFDTILTTLEDGKDTLLGKTHQDGVDLSEGGWQRLAFARAIISPAKLKILDEPTAALDPVAESQVYTQFETISRGVTTIFISHRLASAKRANLIYVLDKGKIIEQGSHVALIQQNGLYAEMYENQKSWYV
jgi:ATP-binding cassette subfamily B protein